MNLMQVIEKWHGCAAQKLCVLDQNAWYRQPVALCIIILLNVLLTFPSYHGIYFWKMYSGKMSNKCFQSLDESSALLVCPTVFIALTFILNILCFFVSFHSSSFQPQEANAASVFLSYLNYFHTLSPYFMSCLYELGSLFCLLIKFQFNFL